MSRGSDTMKTTPAITCMKLMMTIFNFIFWFSGIAILSLGIWMKVELYLYMQLTSVYYAEAPYVLIGVGVGILVVGTLGCCCTVKGKSNMLYIYAVFLVLFFIADLAVAISAFLYRGKIEDGFEQGLADAMVNYAKDDEMKETMDKMQQRFQCCGNDTYKSWYSIPWDGKTAENKVPLSCCKDEENCDNAGSDDIYTDGCYTKLTDFTDSKFLLIGGVVIGFAFLELFGSLLACGLAKHINKNKYEQVA